MSKNTNTINTTFKTPLLNDCTNHLAFQLKDSYAGGKSQPKQVYSSYEMARSDDDVTSEFVRGYN